MDPCPSDHALHLYLQGGLSELQGHVSRCAHCQEVLVALGQAEAPKPPAAWPPAQVDEYTLVRLLGKGAMGEVHLARDTKLERDVALKFLATPGDEGSERLIREARAVARVDHPNVVGVHRVGEVAGRPYLVTELVEGTTLAELPKPLPTAEVRQLALQLARGLAAAHAQDVLHRDLKPHNVMVAKDGTAKLLDFGLSKASADPAQAIASATDLRLTQTGAIVGTPRYLAPELWAGQPATVQSDLWAFGVVLYELLTGHEPFSADSLAALRAKVLAEAPAPIAPRAPADAAALCAVIDRCLARAPEARFASADALVVALEAAVPGKRRRRWLPAVALVLGFALAGARLVALPSAQRSLAFTCRAATPADAFLAEAACARVQRHWCEDARPYRCGPNANVDVVLTVARAGEGVAIEVAAGPAGGWARGFAEVTAPSVMEALASLSPDVERHIGDGRAPLPPSDAEVAAAKALGTSSIPAYRAWRRAVAVHMGVIHIDHTRADEVIDAVLKEDPGWAHPYAMRLMHLEMAEPKSSAVLAAARAAQKTPAQDSVGVAMLDALEAIGAERIPAAVAALSPLVAQHPNDALLGYLHALCLYFARAPEQAIAASRRLAEAFPELQFGSDLASQLFEAGRQKELEGFAAAWLKRDPANEQALLLQMGLAVARGDAAEVSARGADYLRIHGHAPHRWATLSDALMGVGRLKEAHALADRLVAVGGIHHAKGMQRVGLLAIREGRFGAAIQALSTTEVEGREALQGLQALQSVQRLVGQHDAARASLDRLAEAYRRHKLPDLEAVAKYERALEGGGCPPYEPLLPATRGRQDALVAMQRARAHAGCGGCAEVVRAGFSPAERSAVSLFHFGLCAMEEKQLPAAEEAFRRAVLLAPNLNHGMMRFSPVESTLALFHLARALEAQGKHDEAAARDQQFLEGWAGAAAQVPEVQTARDRLADLSGRLPVNR